MFSTPPLPSYSCYDETQKWPKAVEEAWVYLSYSSTLLFIAEENWDRNSNGAGTWRQELMQNP